MSQETTDMTPDDPEFRDALRDVLARSGLSMRALSAAMGRDPGYVAALLDPSRPSRARPTPADLLAASDVTGISFVELLESMWGIEPERLAVELRGLDDGGPADAQTRRLTPDERTLVADFADLLVARRTRHPRR
jgi:transcriptional regulator with XRE-family HTH domain